MSACVEHARACMESAEAVQRAGHSSIAYHLATLALEELGKRELLAVEGIASRAPIPPAWPRKYAADHVKKLFWCFFGGNFLAERLTAGGLAEIENLARRIHDTRLAGLYVDRTEDGLSIPSEAVTSADADKLIGLARIRLEMAAAQMVRDNIPDDEIDQQAWFLRMAEDPERRRQILSAGSLEKLAELKDVKAWGRWLRDLFEKAESDALAAATAELDRSRNHLPEDRTKDKWRIRVRILTPSHSIRQKALNAWNERVQWIKLTAAKKDELLIDIILGDHVPVDALWYFAWGLSRHFVVALNIATMGYWWWHLPEQVDQYYEKLEDLDAGQELAIQRVPSLKIDWGGSRTLTEADLARVATCLNALSGPKMRGPESPINFYIGGLTFLALNDVHWQCEIQALGNFMRCLRDLMLEHGDLQAEEGLKSPFLSFLDSIFADTDDRPHLATLCDHFDSDNWAGATVTLKDVSFFKFFCDTYFMQNVAGLMRADPEPAGET
ncbi:MAG: AbiV family abortive infection protein [Proteobacteria bacterium]|nr:AbiV family abortive infection protein [Pseudomonadota bacterium]